MVSRFLAYEYITFPDTDFPFIVNRGSPAPSVSATYAEHWHEAIELIYLTEGSAKVFIDKKCYLLNKGDIAVINTGSLHIIVDEENTSKHFYLLADEVFCESNGFNISLTKLSPIIRDDEVNVLFDKIIKEISENDSHFKSAVKSYTLLLLTHLFRYHLLCTTSQENSTFSRHADLIKQAIIFVRKNFDKDISVDITAMHLGISRYHFCRTFKSVTGTTFSKYLNLYRCYRAEKLLLTGKNVTEAAQLCGFNNLSYFTRTYKNCIGNLPSETQQKGL